MARRSAQARQLHVGRRLYHHPNAGLQREVPGSIGAPFMRGDGALLNGVLKASQNKAHQHVFSSPQYLYGETGGSSSFYGTTASVTPIFTRNTTSEGGAEAHPTFASGVWTVQAFGTVTNAGSVDAAQLASDLGVAQSTLQQLKGQVFGTGQQLRSCTTVLRTWYQNTTGRPILVGFHCVGVAAGTIIVAGYLNNVSGNAGSVPYHYDTTLAGMPACVAVSPCTCHLACGGWPTP